MTCLIAFQSSTGSSGTELFSSEDEARAALGARIEQHSQRGERVRQTAAQCEIRDAAENWVATYRLVKRG